jgi:hypothetical protein
MWFRFLTPDKTLQKLRKYNNYQTQIVNIQSKYERTIILLKNITLWRIRNHS